MWNHQQPHLYDNVTQLEMDMTLNREFAKVQSSMWQIHSKLDGHFEVNCFDDECIQDSWFQTFAVLWMLCFFFWVISLCLNFMFWNISTKNSDAGESPKRKNTTFRILCIINNGHLVQIYVCVCVFRNEFVWIQPKFSAV